ncbi:exported hypothetical protein [uncultured Stenotrophomonas sp.]|uniref:Secreted protein n=1 Tax=uncultured Stenotrophomonas sp. TaxID=165438 RepID=A0A1Y5QAE8_9GAMM|nr:exported hypothetical protein [uncultured Stenotrophomonas sp.]
MLIMRIHIAMALAAITGAASANDTVILDCLARDGDKIRGGQGAEIYKISKNGGIYIWLERFRLYAGEGRNWTRIEDSGYCNINNDKLISNYSFGDEKYIFKCESGYPDLRRKASFSFDRIEGFLHASMTQLGGESYIFNEHFQCKTTPDPLNNPAPAPKF